MIHRADMLQVWVIYPCPQGFPITMHFSCSHLSLEADWASMVMAHEFLYLTAHKGVMWLVAQSAALHPLA